MSQLQQIVIHKVLSAKNKDSERAGNWGVMTQREWGEVSSLLKAWVINLRNLPMDVVFIAQDRVSNLDGGDESEIDPEVGPQLSPAVAKTLNAAVHFIGNTFIRRRVIKKNKGTKKGMKTKIEYGLRIGPNPVYVTKVRKPKSIIAPSVIVDATYDDIIQLIQGE